MRAPMSVPRVTSFLAPRARTSSSPSAADVHARHPAVASALRRRPPVARTAGRRRARAASRSCVGRRRRRARGRRAGRGSARARRRAASRTRRSRSIARARSARLRTAWSPKTASSSFWPSTAEPPAMPTSAPVTPAVWAKTTTISATAEPVDAVGQEAGGGALVGTLGADHVEHVLLPVAHRALGPAAEVARGAAEVLAGVVEQRAARRPATATTPRPARRRPRRARGSASPGRTRRRR